MIMDGQATHLGQIEFYRMTWFGRGRDLARTDAAQPPWTTLNLSNHRLFWEKDTVEYPVMMRNGP